MSTINCQLSTKIKALILAGGLSSRMGKDKAQINYHGSPQVLHLFSLLKKEFEDVFISVSKRRAAAYKDQPTIIDHWEAIGPMGGIASAFSKSPETAWLVMACDMPGVDESGIKYLLENRNPALAATVFLDQKDKPEPLFAIYEPSIFPFIKETIDRQQYGMRRLLGSTHFQSLKIDDLRQLENVNTPEEMKIFLGV